MRRLLLVIFMAAFIIGNPPRFIKASLTDVGWIVNIDNFL
jgi:hypothetical protein